jgi:uncharacterized protein
MDNGPRGVRRVLTIFGVGVTIALFCIALMTVWLWRNQERVVFQPPSVSPDAPAPAIRVQFAAADGQQLFGYLISPRSVGETNSQTVVIAFHGNADLAAWTVPWATELAERSNVAVFVPEFRGYGGIQGQPTYLTAASDARGALEFAREQLHAKHIVLFGHSLGTAIASELALAMRPAPRAVILQSPFTSARDMAARMLVPPVPWLWRRISRVHYDTKSIVAALDSPVWVAHGSRDLNIPAHMGRQVYAAARRPAELLVVDGAGHNDVADVGGERYWRWLTIAVGSNGQR